MGTITTTFGQLVIKPGYPRIALPRWLEKCMSGFSMGFLQKQRQSRMLDERDIRDFLPGAEIKLLILQTITHEINCYDARVQNDLRGIKEDISELSQRVEEIGTKTAETNSLIRSLHSTDKDHPGFFQVARAQDENKWSDVAQTAANSAYLVESLANQLAEDRRERELAEARLAERTAAENKTKADALAHVSERKARLEYWLKIVAVPGLAWIFNELRILFNAHALHVHLLSH